MLEYPKIDTERITPEGIRYIVDSYDRLSAKSKERIISLVTQRIEEYGFTGFETAYQYIDAFVNRIFSWRYERKVLSWDRSISPGADATIQTFIGNLDWDLEGIMDNSSVPITSACQILLPHLQEKEQQLLEYLVGKSMDGIYRGSFDVEKSGDEIAGQVQQIRDRLITVAGYYEQNGKTLAHLGPIRELGFDPFRISFGRRDFKDPLQHFRNFRSIYGELSRSGLQAFDPGLYYALYRRGLVAEAIPGREKTGPKTERKQMIRLSEEHKALGIRVAERRNTTDAAVLQQVFADFLSNGRNASATAKHFGIGRSTVLRYCHMKEYRTREGSCLTADEKAEVVKAYDIYDGNAKLAEKMGDHKQATYLKYWRLAGKEIRPNRSAYQPDEKAEMVSLYYQYHQNATLAHDNSKFSRGAIAACWKENGLPVRNGSSLFRHEIALIISTCRACDGNLSEAMRRLDNKWSYNTIRKHFNEWKERYQNKTEASIEPNVI